MLSRRNQVGLAVGLLALFALIYWASPAFRSEIERVTGLLGRGDVVGLRDYLLSFGLWAPVISAVLMVFQSVVAPLPAFVITFTNGLLFGAFWGTLLSWSSAKIGRAHV